MLLTITFLLIFAACVGFCYAEGLWSNLVRLVNLIVAGLLAMNFYEPLAQWLTGMMPSYTYFWDFIAIWAVLIAAFTVLKTITDAVSKVKVRFLGLVDRIGSGLLSLWIGWVAVTICATSFHMAPLAREPFFGAFQPEARLQSSAAPELYWLGFTQRMSEGTYCRWASEEDWEKERTVFDARGEFLPKYTARRTKLENHARLSATLRIRPDQIGQHQ